MQTVLGIDLGTQNVKVVFYDFDKRQAVAVESAPLDLYEGDGGEAEQQAHWWTNALRESMLTVGKGVRRSVVAIGVSGHDRKRFALIEPDAVRAVVGKKRIQITVAV